MEKQRSVAFHTLGCKLNFSETSTLSRNLESEGFLKKEFDDIADFVQQQLVKDEGYALKQK